MLSMRRAWRNVIATLAAIGLVTITAAPVSAQDTAGQNAGAISVAGAIDFSNAYMFRGIVQETEGLIMWPYLDLGMTLYEGDGGVSSFAINFGTWNSLHASSPSGTDNPRNGKLWYESDFYAGFGLGFAGGVSTGVTYTAYTSPNDAFTTVKELAFKLEWDDSEASGSLAMNPWVLVAAEFDTDSARGQADGAHHRGTYLELGVAPGYAAPRWSVSVPLKVGLSIGDYYEHPDTDEDDRFGFASLAGIVTVPFTTMPTRFGTWDVHAGVEVLKLNKTTRTLLGDLSDDGRLKSWKGIYSVGIGFSY